MNGINVIRTKWKLSELESLFTVSNFKSSHSRQDSAQGLK